MSTARDSPETCFKLEVYDFLVGKKQLGQIIDRCIQVHGTDRHRRGAGQHQGAWAIKYSTKGAITVAVVDAVIPPKKKNYLAEAEKQHRQASTRAVQARPASPTRSATAVVIEVWEKTTDDVTRRVDGQPGRVQPHLHDGRLRARAVSMNQIRQLAGMRGLIANTSGTTIEIPIKANYREGLNSSGILHLLPRRPQGPGRYRAAYRGLGLSDPPSGGRFAGCDHPRGRLRHRQRASEVYDINDGNQCHRAALPSV